MLIHDWNQKDYMTLSSKSVEQKMMLDKLFDLFDQEEERRYEDELNGPEPLLASVGSNRYKIAYDRFVEMEKKHLYGQTTSTGENLDAIKKFGLSVEEASLIYMYTSHGIHDEVNLRLREDSGFMDKDIAEYALLLDKALIKMPSYDFKIVYRDISNPYPGAKEILEYYQDNLGKIIVEKYFLSSHIEKGRWSDDETGVQLRIKACSNSFGKDLSELSFNVNEREVLFRKNTLFKVENVYLTKNVVELNEIENTIVNRSIYNIKIWLNQMLKPLMTF